MRNWWPRPQAAEKRADRLEIEIPFTKRLGDKVIIAHDVEKGYGDRLLIDDLSFSLPPAGIVGVVGPNGAGKTDSVPDDHRSRGSRLRIVRNRAVGGARLCRPKP